MTARDCGSIPCILKYGCYSESRPRINSQDASPRMFFSFDGIDGVGKSTQIALFCDWLSSEGHDVVSCRDPGSTAVGEAIRDLLLGHRGAGMALRTETLLYMAARAQMVEEIVKPALAAGKTVVADRFLL